MSPFPPNEARLLREPGPEYLDRGEASCHLPRVDTGGPELRSGVSEGRHGVRNAGPAKDSEGYVLTEKLERDYTVGIQVGVIVGSELTNFYNRMSSSPRGRSCS